MNEKVKARKLRQEHLGHTVTLRKANVNDVPRRFYLAQITFGHDNRPRPAPTILLKGSDRVVYKADPWDDIEVEGMPGPGLFTTRPTETGDDVDGIVVMINGEDFLGVYPAVNVNGSDLTAWDIGYWDAVTGEWVELMDEDLAVQLMAYLNKEPGS